MDVIEGYVNPDGSGEGNWVLGPYEPQDVGYVPSESCWNCGYAIAVHRPLETCPTEIEAYQRWGVM